LPPALQQQFSALLGRLPPVSAFRTDTFAVTSFKSTRLQQSCFRPKDSFRDNVAAHLGRLPPIFAFRTDTFAVTLSKFLDFLSNESYLIHF
jgi:hypothetical protein